MKQSRYKSKIFWLGVLSILFLLMSNYGLYDVIQMPEGTFREIINTLCVMFGVFAVGNNPTDKEHF
jgi:uncharacterized membrane protein